MNLEDFQNLCLSKKGAVESFPFGNDTLVLKVMGKVFALAALDNHPATANLKCDPEKAINLREEYDQLIVPGYHMNKKHWNTVNIESNLPHPVISKLVDHSYSLVVEGMTKKLQTELKKM